MLVALILSFVGWSGGPVQARALSPWTPGELLVCAVPGKEAEAAGAVAAAGLRVVEVDALSGVLRVGVPVGKELAWIRLLSLLPEVDYAERNGIGSGGVVPDDTHFGAQWHLRNAGQTGGTSGADIDAGSAWELSTGSASVLVAVLDTGIDTDHPEFAGRIDPRGRDFVNEDDDPEADHPHGTWVSGCLAANANNGFGTTGVDWGCRVLPVKVLNQLNLGTTFDLVQGINYAAAEPDVRVISMSLIGYPNNATLRNALRRARAAGKILIACAGNGGIGNANVSQPGASPFTISIGATTDTDARAGFSGTGSRLDFVAPGAGIATVAQGTSQDVFAVVSGCSFATPITAGVVGLLLALGDERGLVLTQDDVFELLRLGAADQVGLPGEDTPGRDDFHGYGRIDARRSLEAVPIVLPLDVRPGSCPNPLAPGSQGVLPVALLGSALADVTTVDLAGLTLARADGVGVAVAPSAGPPGPGAPFADVGTPYVGPACGCHALGGDGVLDLLLFFPAGELAIALELGTLPAGSALELELAGTLSTGERFVAHDCVTTVPPVLLPRSASAGSR